MKKDTLKKSLFVTMSILLISMMVLFTGCGGGTETLEDYVNSNDEIKTEIESYSQDGMTVKVEGNVLTYEYQYPDTYDEKMCIRDSLCQRRS